MYMHTCNPVFTKSFLLWNAWHVWYVDCIAHFLQNLLRLSFGSIGAAAAAGFSPEAGYQAGSLPSSVSDALEAVVGPALDDLSLDELETGMGPEIQGDGEVRIFII